MKLASRFAAAFRLLVRGSIAPFDRIPRVGEGASRDSSLGRPYEQSPWVMRAIKRIADPIAAVPLEFYDPAADEKVEAPELDAFWQAPVIGADGERMPIADVTEALVGWLKLRGEFFLIRTGAVLPFPDAPNAAASGLWAPLVIAPPGSMREVAKDGRLQAWVYTDPRGRRETFLPEQVIFRRFWNPYHPIRGLAEYEAARMAAESDRSAATFMAAMNDANGDTGVWVTAKNGPITDEAAQKQITAQLREKRELAQRGIYRAGFLNGDVEIHEPTVRAPDANAIAARLHNRHEVAIALGLPPSMFDVVASYSIGSASDRYLLITETCLPLSRKIAGGFSAVGSTQLGRPVEARHDWDDHPVLQAVRRERIDTALKLWGAGMPMDEVSEYLDLGLPEFPSSDAGFLPFSLAPAESVSGSAALPDKQPEGITPPPAGEDEEGGAPGQDDQADESAQDIAAQVAAALRARSSGSSPHSLTPSIPSVCQCCAPDLDPDDLSLRAAGLTPAQIAAWREHMRARARTVRDYRSKFARALFEARAETLANIAQAGAAATLSLSLSPSLAKRSAAVQLTFTRETWRTRLFTLMRQAAEGALQSAGQQVFAEVGRADDPWRMPPPEVADFVRQRENRLADTADSVWESVRDEIDRGLQSGDSTAQLAARVKRAFNNIDDRRAHTIALTETAAAYGTGRQAAMQSAGVKWKRWLTSGNANVRAAHRDANRQTVPVSEPFIVDGEALMNPGDPKGKPANVINCHCVSIPVPTEDAP